MIYYKENQKVIYKSKHGTIIYEPLDCLLPSRVISPINGRNAYISRSLVEHGSGHSRKSVRTHTQPAHVIGLEINADFCLPSDELPEGEKRAEAVKPCLSASVRSSFFLLAFS